MIQIPSKGIRRRTGETRMIVYDYLISYTQSHGFPPTLREICTGVGVSSTATVAKHLKNLENEHLISRMTNRARAVAPTTQPY